MVKYSWDRLLHSQLVFLPGNGTVRRRQGKDDGLHEFISLVHRLRPLFSLGEKGHHQKERVYPRCFFVQVVVGVGSSVKNILDRPQAPRAPQFVVSLALCKYSRTVT